MYFISRGKVKPANKAFAAVRNDYTIHLDNGCGAFPLLCIQICLQFFSARLLVLPMFPFPFHAGVVTLATIACCIVAWLSGIGIATPRNIKLYLPIAVRTLRSAKMRMPARCRRGPTLCPSISCPPSSARR